MYVEVRGVLAGVDEILDVPAVRRKLAVTSSLRMKKLARPRSVLVRDPDRPRLPVPTFKRETDTVVGRGRLRRAARCDEERRQQKGATRP
jgi:hypothetical protein